MSDKDLGGLLKATIHKITSIIFNRLRNVMKVPSEDMAAKTAMP
jgi:hypothetical protein